MEPVGYAHLVRQFGLRVRPPRQIAFIDRSVNRRIDTADRILFPARVALTPTPLGHLEFALRHEDLDLALLAELLPRIGPAALSARLVENPNGEYLRRAAFLYEWFTGQALDGAAPPSAGYVELLDSARYAVAGRPRRNAKFRILDNALGDARFCPVVHRSALPPGDWLSRILGDAHRLTKGSGVPLYERALNQLYLSETRSSFAIEREVPTAGKEERFLRILERAGESSELSEERLVAIQNEVVRDEFSREASYRTRQNWMSNASGRLTFLPHPPEALRETMAGWKSFINDRERGIDPLVKAACAAFGFVYLHPFLDGNGRLHRFVIHHALAHCGFAPPDLIVPVSAVIMKHIPAYHEVLTGFSRPVTALWDYRLLDDGPQIIESPGAAPYRYFNADREVSFLREMIEEAVLREIPTELGFLRGYDRAQAAIDARFDLPHATVSALIRMIHGNGGQLARGKRKQFYWVPDEVIADIERLVREAFNEGGGSSLPAAGLEAD